MTKARLNAILITAFVLISILLGVISYLSWRSNQDERVANREVHRTYECISKIEQISTLSRDAQTDARNYQLTGKKEYLAAFQHTTQVLPDRLKTLKQDLYQEPLLLPNLQKLETLVLQRLQLGQRLLRSRGAQEDAATTEQTLAEGRAMLEQIRPLVVSLSQHQQQAIGLRQQQAEDAYQRTQRRIALSTGAAVIIIALAFCILQSQLVRRIHTEKRLRQYEAELQTQLRQQQEQNQALDQLNQQLVRSNENLQQFAYIASHDLQEPLRKIQSFSNLLEDQYQQALDDNGRDLLHRMQSASSRMSLLIKDLLAFSRISTQQAPSLPVSLESVVQQSLENLAIAIGESKAQIEVQPLPMVLGDATQLGQLFQNLLSNALKFRHKDIPPRVSIRVQQVAESAVPATIKPSRPQAQYYQIDIADNGIGFDEKYTDRIFQMFQRLHGKQEFAGTGVGLAICQKVAVNHGGGIIATSQPGLGATFSIFLPVIL